MVISRFYICVLQITSLYLHIHIGNNFERGKVTKRERMELQYIIKREIRP